MASPATNVIPIDTDREPRTHLTSSDTTALGVEEKKPVESSATPVDDVPRLFSESSHARDTKTVRLSQSDLYPARHAFSPEHITALRLLRLAVGRCRRAIDAQNDPMSADIEIQKVQMLLPKLFCCRSLGDGFGTVINALIYVFANARGNSFTSDQIRILARVFQGLRDKPFLTTAEADDAVEELESGGFNPYPAELIEFLSSDPSVR